MNADVIVVSYRTARDLSKFCDSLVESPEGIATVTIVNNQPRDIDVLVAEENAKHLKEMLGVPVMTVVNEENVGYAKAVNNAALKVTAPVLAIFNADVMVKPGTIQAMCDFIDSNELIGIAGPKQVNSQRRITHAGVIGSNRRPNLRGWHRRDEGQFDDVLLDCVSVSGSAYFVRRECWDELTNCPVYQSASRSVGVGSPEGAFLPTPLYYEETFCSVHADAHGWLIGYNGMAEMVHEWQGSCKDNKVLTKYMTISRGMYRKVCDLHEIPRE